MKTLSWVILIAGGAGGVWLARRAIVSKLAAPPPRVPAQPVSGVTASIPAYDASGALTGEVLWVSTPDQTARFGPRIPDSYLSDTKVFVFHDATGGAYSTYTPTWTVQSLQMEIAAGTPTTSQPPPTPLPAGYVWIYGDPTKTYYAGFSRPFFVTKGMISSALADRHVELTGIYKRESAPPVDPKRDPKYSDDWDEWMTAKYTGAPGWFQAERQWNWLVS